MSLTFEVAFTEEILLRLTNHFSQEEGTCLLYSGSSYDTAERSFLFLFPFEVIEISDPQDSWERLKAYIQPSQKWVGFLSYEMGAPNHTKYLEGYSTHLPLAYFQRSKVVVIFEHQKKKASITCLQDDLLDFMTPDAFQCFVNNLKPIEVTPCDLSLHIVETMDTYETKISRAQKLIKDGEIYQVNLSHQVEFEGEADPFSLFYQLVQLNPSPFSVFFRLRDYAIVSSSPERFLKKQGSLLETRPIKGTIARGKTNQEDRENRKCLLASEKNYAELLMITDLMRNDLGKVSLTGTVVVEKLVHCEAYTNVYHLMSVIRSQSKEIHPVDIIKACFPGGSVTGCPKIKAVEVITLLEKRARGIYTGSIGYISESGDFDFNIAIRTLVFAKEKISLQLGGAITADSDAKEEYEETIVKGKSFFQLIDNQ